MAVAVNSGAQSSSMESRAIAGLSSDGSITCKHAVMVYNDFEVETDRKSDIERSKTVTLAQLVYQLSTNTEFASAFRAEPRLKLAAVGATVGDEELSALLQVLETKEEQGRALMGALDFPLWFSDTF